MMAKDLIIAGAGGSGREILALLDDIEATSPGTFRFLGFVADSPPLPGLMEGLGAKFLGSPNDPELLSSLRGASFSVGIGRGSARRKVENRLLGAGLLPATLIHPSVHIGRDVEIGVGTVICAGSVVTTHVRLGVSVQININCVVCHDSVMGDYSTWTPGVSVTGNVNIGEDVYVGTNASFIPGVRVGDRSLIGAGAVVARDVPADSVAKGVPAKARPTRWDEPV